MGSGGIAAESEHFGRGDVVVYRGIDEHHRVVSAIPVRVVQDVADLVALWLPLGTPTIKPELINREPGAPRHWTGGNWELTNGRWSSAELLILVRQGERRATWVRWSASREFQGWAVNLQSRLFRTRLGFDTLDHQLDIVVDPDRRWHFKDDDELTLAVELGRMSMEQADAVRREAAHAVKQIENNHSPFCDGWERWSPDPAWTVPQLISNWDDVSMYGQ
jgi:hypothetical protein